jgi:serine/threonine protein kinase
VGGAAQPEQGEQLGRYAIYGEIASGGMATVHLGMLVGSAGFSRAVAIKKLHPMLAKDPDFAAMFLDEARLAARIRHPNVVSTLDVVSTDGQLFLVMEYVQGETLAHLCKTAARRQERIPPAIVSGIVIGALTGLHAAHEAKDERGEPLNIVHRDVSPQNIMVGTDGIARVLDFGVAKAAGRSQMTRSGQLKGKLAYMSPEQIGGEGIDRRTDTFAATIVLWEALVGRRLYGGENEGEVFAKVMKGGADPPSQRVPDLSNEFDTIIVRGLSKNPEVRFQTARDMAIAVSRAAAPASAFEIGEWVERLAADSLGDQARRIAEIESGSASQPRGVLVASEPPPPPAPPPPPLTVPTVPMAFAPVRVPLQAAAPVAAADAQTTGDARRKWIVVGVLALVGLAGAILLTASMLRHVEPAASTAQSETPLASAVSPPPSAPAAISVAQPTPEPMATDVPSARATTRTPPAAPIPPSGPKVDPCNPPFTVDSRGVKHYKAQCL